MYREEIPNNIEALKAQKDKKNKKKNVNEEIILSEAFSYGELESLMDENFENYNNKMSLFVNKLSSKNEKDINKRYKELGVLRKEISLKLEDYIKELNTITEPEKERLLLKLNIFIMMHNFFETEREFLDVSGRFNNNDNRANKLKSETQQYLSIAIINNQKESLEELEKYRSVAENVYELPYQKKNGKRSESFNSLESGVIGVSAAYFYYSGKGYKVIFTKPELDANYETDLLLVEEGAYNEMQEEFERTDIHSFQDLNKLSLEARNKVIKCQVKCGRRQMEDKEEFIYNPAKTEDRYYSDEKDKAGWKFEKNDHKKEQESFFNKQCRPYNFRGQFLKLKFDHALETVKDS